jgi:hypothetical protein
MLYIRALIQGVCFIAGIVIGGAILIGYAAIAIWLF